MFIVLEKELRTENIITQAHFEKYEDAVEWMEEMSSIWVEERAYKIIER
jgi:transposase-like protein